MDENSKEIETVLEYPHDNNKLLFESDPELNYLSILENFITSNEYAFKFENLTDKKCGSNLKKH